uniref:Uncharacterized protein n=1 Tax=Setaria italica TaxID=4555 RepID=K3ZGD7_SETIT
MYISRQQILANIASTRLPPQRSCLLLQLHTAKPSLFCAAGQGQYLQDKT